MNNPSRTAFVLLGALVLIASGCGRTEESAPRSSSQHRASRQTTPKSPSAPAQEATAPPGREIKANSVQIAYEGIAITLGESEYKLDPSNTPGQPQPRGPLGVVIFRQIAPQNLDAAKEWGVKVGGAYIQKGPTEYEYIREVDLGLPDVELARQFGVEPR